MLGPDSTRLLKTMLETMSEVEMIIECQRQALCNIPEFAPYSGFCRIDRTAQESIRPQDVLAFMKDNGCNVKLSDCARLVNFFDSDEDGILSYQDFI